MTFFSDKYPTPLTADEGALMARRSMLTEIGQRKTLRVVRRGLEPPSVPHKCKAPITRSKAQKRQRSPESTAAVNKRSRDVPPVGYGPTMIYEEYVTAAAVAAVVDSPLPDEEEELTSEAIKFGPENLPRDRSGDCSSPEA